MNYEVYDKVTILPNIWVKKIVKYGDSDSVLFKYQKTILKHLEYTS